MAQLEIGSLKDFSVIAEKSGSLRSSESIFSLENRAGDQATGQSVYFVSPDMRGLTLQSLMLREEFQGFFDKLFDRQTDIYFLAWTWDMTDISFYPGPVTDPKTCVIPLRGNEVREFIGEGAILFPPRPVTAGMAVRIQIWESNEEARDFGELMQKLAQAISSSELNTIVTAVAAAATGGAALPISGIQAAAVALTETIGNILKETSDQLVDYFEGYFPSAQPWDLGPISHKGEGSEITLNRLG